MPFFSSHREYVEKSMRERTRGIGPVGPWGPWEKLLQKLWLEFIINYDDFISSFKIDIDYLLKQNLFSHLYQ